VDIRTVAGRLGHRDASTTLNTYSHFIPETDQKAAAVLGKMLDDAILERTLTPR
jgi:integrase